MSNIEIFPPRRSLLLDARLEYSSNCDPSRSVKPKLFDNDIKVIMGASVSASLRDYVEARRTAEVMRFKASSTSVRPGLCEAVMS